MNNKKDKFVPLAKIPIKPSLADIEQIEDINSRIKDLEKKIIDIGKSAERVQRQAEKISNFVLAIVVGIAVVVGVAFFEVSLDYFKNNEARYEKFINKTEEIKDNFYTREQLKLPLENIDKTTEILNCFKIRGYFSPQCFN